jgi:hypothetical protein
MSLSVRLASVLSVLVLQVMVPAAPAHAETAAEAVQQMVGAWEISNADRDKKCAVTFAGATAPGGLKLELDPACATIFPPMKDIVAWTLAPNGPLRLIDPKGVAILEFSEVESGIFEAERRGEGLYFMQTQAAAMAPQRTPEQMFGDWQFLREADRPLCTLTLLNAAVGATYKLAVKPGCNAAIAAFGLTGWRLEGDQLVLSGTSGNWRFVESDITIWERIPPSTDPLLLMR